MDAKETFQKSLFRQNSGAGEDIFGARGIAEQAILLRQRRRINFAMQEERINGNYTCSRAAGK